MDEIIFNLLDRYASSCEVIAILKMAGLEAGIPLQEDPQRLHALDVMRTNRVNVENYINTIQAENDRLLEEVERLRVQLAGCSVAASGYAEKPPLDPSAYGWSVAYQDVANLYERYENLLEENARLKSEVERLAMVRNGLDIQCCRWQEDSEKLEEEIARLREAARWIPVSERLPENYEEVFVFGNSHFGIDSKPFYKGVTHWRLPEPPEEVE